jgi:hypothetical protein
VLRPVLTVGAYSWALPAWHGISISTVDGFIWTRIFILLLRYSPIPVREYRVRYALAVFAAGCLGFVLGDSGAGAGGNGGEGAWWMGMYVALTGTLALGLRATRWAQRTRPRPSSYSSSSLGVNEVCPPTIATPALSRSSSSEYLHLENVITPSESVLDLQVAWSAGAPDPVSTTRTKHASEAHSCSFTDAAE